MGSAGSGRFGTYRGGSGSGGGGSGSGSGSSGGGEIECPIKIENIRLEDVATSEYYINNHSLPPASTLVFLSDKIYNGRLVVRTIDSNEIIGNLPTQYNFLINCMKKNMNYKGFVVASNEKPIPFVVVTLNA